jgi:hypothetical protein
MALQLSFEVLNASLSTMEGLKVEIVLANDGPEPLEIPHLIADASGALEVNLFELGGRLQRQMSGITRQMMLTIGRPDLTPVLGRLEPGQSWSWVFDSAFHHYSIPAGAYEVEAAYRFPPLEIELRAPRVRIEVSAPQQDAVQMFHENPVLDGVTLLLRTLSSPADSFFLRQHSYLCPLAAWYSEPVLLDRVAGAAFCIPGNYYRNETLDPFFAKWLVWTSEADIHALMHVNGRPQSEERIAPLPAGRELLGGYSTFQNEVNIFAITSGMLECYVLESGSLRPIFEHTLPAAGRTLISIRADERYIHLLLGLGGLLYQRLTLDGQLLESRQLARTRLRAYSISYDPVTEQAKGLFWEGPQGKLVQMVVSNFKPALPDFSLSVELPLRGEIRELSFDCSAKGVFHLLATTADRRLYYFGHTSGPALIAEGEDRFYPLVLASRGVYLGCYRNRLGYRFLRFSRRKTGSRIVNFDAILSRENAAIA